MYAPPAGFGAGDLRRALAAGWAVTAAGVAYLPVGFGSHHWDVTDAAGARWFVTVDDLETHRTAARDTRDDAFAHLTASLAVAVALQAAARPVVAPVPARDGAPAVRAGDRWSVALYPYLEGRGYGWGDRSDPDLPRALLDLVVAVHTAPPDVAARARADDVARLPDRDAVEALLAGARPAARLGPYARPAAELVAAHADALRRRYARYDELAATVAARRLRSVLTHGEPHPGNVLRTADGWRLVDWDTALLAPPERDLWDLDLDLDLDPDPDLDPDRDLGGDPGRPAPGRLLAAYAAATGYVPDPDALALYRLRWDLADLAAYVARFTRPHTGDADDDESWRQLVAYLRGVTA